MNTKSPNNRWKEIRSKGFKKFFWTRFPFLFIPLLIFFFKSEAIIKGYNFNEAEDLWRILFYSIIPAAYSSIIISLIWKFKNRK